MKKFKLLSLFFAALSILFISCKSDEPSNNDVVVEDGFYISGDASAYSALTVSGQFQSAVVENDNNSTRVGLLEKYVALETGKTFTITEVAGTTKTVYGPGSTFKTVDQAEVTDEMTAAIQMGNYAAGGTFTVPASGLYHMIVDKQTKSVTILPVSSWAIIGGATPLGWSDNVMAAKGTFNKDSMVFEITDITLLQGDFKFRHSGAWKQTIVADPLVKVNTNFGGTSLTTLTAGGSNIPFVKADNGKYTVTAVWTKTSGMKFSMKKTGDVVVAEYPANVYMIGESIGGWAWDGSYIVTMKPVHSHPNAFWAIVYINASAVDGGFKFSPVKDWIGDFGVTGTATDGIYAKGGSNITTATAGYYMVYVDLKSEKISVTPAEVYLIGATINGVWDYAAPAGKFTVDNTAKTITSPACLAGELRMYAVSPLAKLDTPIADWWQTEFMVLSGKIEYRGTGDDQARVQVTAGQKVVLSFVNGTGTIQ